MEYSSAWGRGKTAGNGQKIPEIKYQLFTERSSVKLHWPPGDMRYSRSERGNKKKSTIIFRAKIIQFLIFEISK